MAGNPEGLVSIIIPTFYRNENLREAIETAIKQEYKPVEVIVVDDSGERHAESIALDYQVTYIPHEKNCGANAARNTGINQASGEFIQLLDDDDRLDEQKLRKQVELLRSKDDVGVVYCGVVHDTGRRVLPDPDVCGAVLERALTFDMTPCMTSTMLLRRDVVDAIHPLKDRPSADDLGFMIELARITLFDFVDEVLVRKAVSDSSRGQGVTNAMERLHIIDEYDHLYNELLPHIRAETLSETYHRLGAHLLNERLWSATAVSAYWNALRYNPDPGLFNYLGCLVALFGRPGRSVANHFRRLVAD